jgi:hypothetical protein
MTAAPTPTQVWQSMAPNDLPALDGPADIAERLLLLLHYGIDWDNSWVADPRYRKKYWDELPTRVRRAAYRASTLDQWWSNVSTWLDAPAPRQRDRRLELACLLREPPCRLSPSSASACRLLSYVFESSPKLLPSKETRPSDDAVHYLLRHRRSRPVLNRAPRGLHRCRSGQLRPVSTREDHHPHR